MSQPDPLHLAERNFVLRPIVKFGCPRRLMASHLLGVLQPADVLQVNGDAGCSPGVTSDGGEKTREANFANRFGVSRINALSKCSGSRVA
jgi:hypothetical protein